MKKNLLNEYLTDDKIIREKLRVTLEKKAIKYRTKGSNAQVFEELGVKHGFSRIDFAIINGIMDGYEIKSDKDNLNRLPQQMKEFGEVFDKLTIVVGKKHLLEAIKILPSWWGIILAKKNKEGSIILQTIRTPLKNKNQNKLSLARLLWKEEALSILENKNKQKGLKNKTKETIYNRLTNEISITSLKKEINNFLISREDWRFVETQKINDDL